MRPRISEDVSVHRSVRSYETYDFFGSFHRLIAGGHHVARWALFPSRLISKDGQSLNSIVVEVSRTPPRTCLAWALRFMSMSSTMPYFLKRWRISSSETVASMLPTKSVRVASASSSGSMCVKKSGKRPSFLDGGRTFSLEDREEER